MGRPLIKRADDNKSKGRTYSVLLGKYKEAMDKGFYGEAELVVYAFLEDRLRSFIYYSDLLDSFNSNKINENAEIINGGELDIKNISGKIRLIRKALNSCSLKTDEMSPFEKSLKKRYTAVLKVSELKKALNRIDKWCKYRNEIVHALFNKDLSDLREGYENHVRDGMQLARYVDAQVQRLKDA